MSGCGVPQGEGGGEEGSVFCHISMDAEDPSEWFWCATGRGGGAGIGLF